MSESPPDATFTLRLAHGTVKGFPAEGTWVAPFTTFYGLFDRSLAHGGKEPWALPVRWKERMGAIDGSVPLNFVSTNDIIGGNSGSPVINSRREVVGLVFDGNLPSLGGDYWYDVRMNRAVAVHSGAIMQALQHVYGANDLVKEIEGR